MLNLRGHLRWIVGLCTMMTLLSAAFARGAGNGAGNGRHPFSANGGTSGLWRPATPTGNPLYSNVKWVMVQPALYKQNKNGWHTDTGGLNQALTLRYKNTAGTDVGMAMLLRKQFAWRLNVIMTVRAEDSVLPGSAAAQACLEVMGNSTILRSMCRDQTSNVGLVPGLSWSFQGPGIGFSYEGTKNDLNAGDIDTFYDAPYAETQQAPHAPNMAALCQINLTSDAGAKYMYSGFGDATASVAYKYCVLPKSSAVGITRDVDVLKEAPGTYVACFTFIPAK